MSLLNNNKNIDKKIIYNGLNNIFSLCYDENIPTTNFLTIKKTLKKIRKDLLNLSNIKFNDEQFKCCKKLIKFLINADETTFGLYGYAGTGKTTTIVELITYLLKNGYINSVVFTAPTNKAVNVIKSKFRHHLKEIFEKTYSDKLSKDFDFETILNKLYIDKIKIDFMTIHRLLEFKIDYNMDGGLIFMKNSEKINKSKNKYSLIDQYELIIIDECSMIPMDLLDVIFNEIRKRKTIYKTPKIIFTGDPAQLPPVNEIHSSIYIKNKDELTLDYYCSRLHSSSIVSNTSDVDKILLEKMDNFVNDIINMKSFTLKKVVRSKIDNVTNFCYEIRKWVFQNDNTYIPNFNHYNNKKGIKMYEYNVNINDKTKTRWCKRCVKQLEKGISSIILTWTNNQTNIYNSYIRYKIFGNTKLEKFVVGDILMLNEFYCLDQNNTNNTNNNENKFYTSDQIVVLETTKTIHQIKQFEIPNNIKKLKHKTRLLLININNTIKNQIYKCWKLNVKKIGDNNGNHIIKVLYDDDIDKYIKLKLLVSTNIITFSKNILDENKESVKQIEQLIVKPLWTQWYEIFISPFANVNYGYAITCHKGQGSNFYNVFVDIHDISKNDNINEVKKCIYTAITRTINNLYLLI
jgi:hypothetical protein